MSPPDVEIGGLPGHPPCPFCSGEETELMNAFGAHASVATYWCRACRSPFELLKWSAGAASHTGDSGDAGGLSVADDPTPERNGR